MKRVSLANAAAACLAPAVALAQDTVTPQVSVVVTAATDYIFRGVSQTQDDPAIFGSARLTIGHFYAGPGIENVDFKSSIDAKYIFLLGWNARVAGGKLYMFVAIDRTSKFAFVKLHENSRTATSRDFLLRLIEAVLTKRARPCLRSLGRLKGRHRFASPLADIGQR